MKWKTSLVVEAILIFVVEMILSVAGTILYNELYPEPTRQSYTACVLLAILCLSITLVLLVVSMIRKANKGYSPYDIAASYLSAFIIFATLSLFLALIGFDVYLTYLFLGYKVFAFGVLTPLASVLIVNAALCAVCVVTPILCNKQFEAERIRSYLKDDNTIDS